MAVTGMAVAVIATIDPLPAAQGADDRLQMTDDRGAPLAVSSEQ
jgi:hypothetical protein